jgi:hypothetical protein
MGALSIGWGLFSECVSCRPQRSNRGGGSFLARGVSGGRSLPRFRSLQTFWTGRTIETKLSSGCRGSSDWIEGCLLRSPPAFRLDRPNPEEPSFREAVPMNSLLRLLTVLALALTLASPHALAACHGRPGHCNSKADAPTLEFTTEASKRPSKTPKGFATKEQNNASDGITANASPPNFTRKSYGVAH